MDFTTLLTRCRGAVERYVYYKMPSKGDGDDILQEVYMTAFQKFDTLRRKEEAAFKAWILKIAQNKCSDFYRKRTIETLTPPDELPDCTLAPELCNDNETVQTLVHDTLDLLSAQEKQILELFYIQSRPQAEIARILGIPEGTVKSRLHYAKRSFQRKYPFPPYEKTPKGACKMKPAKHLPERMPAYTITAQKEAPFETTWEELMGWFIIPKPGEKLMWAIYDHPEKTRGEWVEMKVGGKAAVHGVEGVEIEAIEHAPMEANSNDIAVAVTRHFIAQLTETHCRVLAESHIENGVKKLHTFLDGDAFLPNWGFGEDNCGNETHLKQKGEISRADNAILCENKPYMLDVAGRYTVEINGKSYDTICVMDIEYYNSGVVSEQYIDRDGRTVLWRRFNRNDWAYSRYGQYWMERLPHNERLTVNGVVYVHWYDCITDYIL